MVTVYRVLFALVHVTDICSNVATGKLLGVMVATCGVL